MNRKWNLVSRNVRTIWFSYSNCFMVLSSRELCSARFKNRLDGRDIEQSLQITADIHSENEIGLEMLVSSERFGNFCSGTEENIGVRSNLRFSHPGVSPAFKLIRGNCWSKIEHNKQWTTKLCGMEVQRLQDHESLFSIKCYLRWCLDVHMCLRVNEVHMDCS